MAGKVVAHGLNPLIRDVGQLFAAVMVPSRYPRMCEPCPSVQVATPWHRGAALTDSPSSNFR